MRKFLKSEKSKRFVGGPLTVPLPVLLTMLPKGATPFVGFNWKHAVLNHCKNVCAPPTFGSHNVSGRLPATRAGVFPSPAGSKFEPRPVKGSPVWNVAIPDSSQPPSIWPAKSLRLLNHGTS